MHSNKVTISCRKINEEISLSNVPATNDCESSSPNISLKEKTDSRKKHHYAEIPSFSLNIFGKNSGLAVINLYERVGWMLLTPNLNKNILCAF